MTISRLMSELLPGHDLGSIQCIEFVETTYEHSAQKLFLKTGEIEDTKFDEFFDVVRITLRDGRTHYIRLVNVSAELHEYANALQELIIKKNRENQRVSVSLGSETVLTSQAT